VAKEKKRFWIIAVVLLFLTYFLIAARPIPQETVLNIRWLSSLDSDNAWEGGEPESVIGADGVIPFILGGHFGYVDLHGRFTINREKRGNLSLSETKWTEYEAQPSKLEIRNIHNEITETVEDPRGYPMFLDGQTFIINSEQNAISKIGRGDTVLWNYEFAAPLTCADAAAGLVLTGSVDGVIEVLDTSGKQLFAFEPGGSRYSVILGCAFSRDGMRFALVSGINRQRFLVFERFGNTGGEYKIIYHEFLGEGFRRPVRISFIDGDRRVVFEREAGLGIYEINSRRSYSIALEGDVLAIDDYSGEGRLFVITGFQLSETKNLVGINLPDRIFMTI
jgi:hypothetical protein